MYNVSVDNLIEKGRHAEVYKGQLADGQFVAIQAYCILKFKLIVS